MNGPEARFDPREDRVLRSSVRLARLVLEAHAASVFLAGSPNELVLRATSEQDADRILGLTLSPDEGIAGWVFTTGSSTMVSSVANDSRFARDTAEASGYVPEVIVAVPISGPDLPIGVLEVLDPEAGGRDDLTVIDIVTEIAEQLGVVLASVRQIPEATAEETLGQARTLLDDLSRSLRHPR
jgi:GAF domain-containing protein